MPLGGAPGSKENANEGTYAVSIRSFLSVAPRRG
jgi:hypothetical protein